MAAAGAGIAALAPQIQAQTVIIQDNFTSGSHYGTALSQQTGNSTGLAPDTTNLPGGNWQHINGAWYDSQEYSNAPGNSNPDPFFHQNIASFHNDASAGINLGAYNTGSLQLSAGVYYIQNASTIGQGGTAFVELGYSSQLNTASNYGPPSYQYFTGLMALGNGSLQEYVAGSPLGSAIAYGGTYSAYTPTTLAYTIDTTTGAISNVSFGSSTATYDFTTPGSWSSSDTANTEIGGQAYGGPATAAVSSYVLSTPVPEPSTYAMLAGGALALGASYRRRRQAGM